MRGGEVCHNAAHSEEAFLCRGPGALEESTVGVEVRFMEGNILRGEVAEGHDDFSDIAQEAGNRISNRESASFLKPRGDFKVAEGQQDRDFVVTKGLKDLSITGDYGFIEAAVTRFHPGPIEGYPAALRADRLHHGEIVQPIVEIA